MEQAGQWPSSVAIDTHTLIGLGREVDIINRLSEIQVVCNGKLNSQCSGGGMVKCSSFLGLRSKNCSKK